MERTGPIEQELVETQRRLTRAQSRLIDLMLELDESDEPLASYPDAATWMSWNLGYTKRTCRRWIRMARSLRDLPAVRAAFADGTLSWDQVAMLLRVATPDNQRSLLDLVAQIGDADELREEVRAAERRARDDEATDPPDLEAGPLLSGRWQKDRYRYTGSAPGAEGVLLEKALLLLAEQAPKDESSGLYRDMEERAGEAIVQMASHALAGAADTDRATFVVHVSAEAVATRSGPGWEAATRLFSEEELERLACDARVQPALVDSSGVTVGVGRTTRKIPAWLRRLVEGRDGGCRFPGCGRTRWLHLHHIVPWSQGGPTNLDNLIALCGFHHRLIHSQSWRIEGHPGHELHFFNKHGWRHVPAIRRQPPGWEQIREEMLELEMARRLEQVTGAPP